MAIEDFKRAIEINPAFKTAYFQRGNVYYVQGKYDLAIADFTKFLDLAMSDTDLELSGLKLAYGARSMAYREAGDFAKAVDDANMVIDLDREKNSGIGYYLRGMALAMGGDADKAMDDYEKAAQAKFTPDELHLLHEQIMKALRRA